MNTGFPTFPTFPTQKTTGEILDLTPWTPAEVQTFAARVDLFRKRGLLPHDAEALAERLLQRDREGDDRAICLECRFFFRNRCTNWAAAGMAGKRFSGLGAQYPRVLKRCSGFSAKVEGLEPV